MAEALVKAEAAAGGGRRPAFTRASATATLGRRVRGADDAGSGGAPPGNKALPTPNSEEPGFEMNTRPPNVKLTPTIRGLIKENLRGLYTLPADRTLYHGARYDGDGSEQTHFHSARCFAANRQLAGEYCYLHDGKVAPMASVLTLRFSRDLTLADIRAFPIATADAACSLAPGWGGAAFQMHILPNLVQQFLGTPLDGIIDGDDDVVLVNPADVVKVIQAEAPPPTKEEWMALFAAISN